MDSFLLQDWMTLMMPSPGGVITQSESGWLDLSVYRDIVAWIEVKETSSTSIALAVQSAPTKEESLFATMASVTGLGPPLGGSLSVTPILQDLQTGAAGSAPLARWVRWQVGLGGSAWDLTFRIWIAANKPGRAALNRRNHAHVRSQ